MRSITTAELANVSGGDDWYSYPENPPKPPPPPTYVQTVQMFFDGVIGVGAKVRSGPGSLNSEPRLLSGG